MATVRKRKWVHNGQAKEAWVVAYTDQGGKRRLKTFDKKKDADKYRTKVETEIEAGVHTPARETATFREACEGYLIECERRWRIGDKMSGNTLYKKRSIITNHLIPDLGHYKLTDIDHRLLQDQVNAWADKMKKSTVGELASDLRLVLTFAVQRRWIKLHPLWSEKLHVPGRSIKREIATKAELEMILKALVNRRFRETSAGHRVRGIAITLALFGGLRRGEVCGLQWEDVDFVANVIRIRHSLSRVDGLKDPKSRAGNRTIPMTEPVRKILLWAMGTAEAPTGYVVATKDGTPICTTNIYWYWLATMKEAGLTVPSASKLERAGGVKPKYPFHSLRHAAVSLLIEQGLQPLHVKNFVGHHSVKTTFDIYGHLFPEDSSSRIASERAAGQFAFEVPRDRPSISARHPRDKVLKLIER